MGNQGIQIPQVEGDNQVLPREVVGSLRQVVSGIQVHQGELGNPQCQVGEDTLQQEEDIQASIRERDNYFFLNFTH